MTWIVDHGAGASPRFTQHADEPGTKGVAMGERRDATPREGAFGETWDWTAKAWVKPGAMLEADLLAGIDRERCRRLMAIATKGDMIASVYAAKRAEVLHYDTLGGAAVAALTITIRRQRFAFLMAEVDAGGGTLAEVAERVRARFTAAAAIDGKAVAAKRAVRAATTAAAKQAAAQVNWPS